ncbi:gas vesicle protein [Acrocarpospora catenulata]|uniref:gas vesicle protein n=1 Tax=Acrocarpospora catenulata TaxID=2836182 RepID=UPI001BD93BAA|nr:gas vesicle protein [Acrocarpospora catenulata]
MTEGSRFAPAVRHTAPPAVAGRHEPANLGDILERVLDRGVVIAGDIRVNLLDIELLTIKLRLVIASVDTAREMGIDWWEHDPWLTGDNRGLLEENRRLRARLSALEEGRPLESAFEEGRPLERGRSDDHRD